MKRLITLLMLVCFSCGPSFAHAEMFFNTGFAAPGGDDLIVETDEELEAGAGFYSSIGIINRKEGNPWSCQAMVGFKVNGVEFTGGEATTRAFPVHFMTFYQVKRFRYGVGLTYDLAIELDITGNNPRTVAYKNAPGLALEFNHLLGQRLFWGLRYTEMDYKEKNSGIKSNANHLSGHVGMFF